MTDQQPTGECAVYRPTIWQRLGFNYARRPLMEDEAFPDHAVGALINETFIKLDWVDRLRALVSGKLHVITTSKTDVPVARCVTASGVAVLPPTYPMRPPVKTEGRPQ